MKAIKKNQLKKVLILVILLSSFLSPMEFVFAQGKSGDITKYGQKNHEEKINIRLQEEFQKQEKVSFLIKFKEKANTSLIVEEVNNLARKNRLTPLQATILQRSKVVSTLKTTAQEQQANVLSLLERKKEAKEVEDFRSYYIVNAVSVTASWDVAAEIAKYPEVEKLLLDEQRSLITPLKTEESNRLTEEKIAWHLSQINADRAWELGYDGTGIVVASIDTGVQWDHPALKEKYRGYDKETGEVSHDYNWFDATYSSPEPIDYEGHGSHVTGTMVGSEDDYYIGVAPGAKWIAVNAFTSEGKAYDSDLLAAGEWILAPTDAEGNIRVDMAPDIVNNSWGGGPGLDEWYRDLVTQWRNANIYPVFAAGNVEMFNPGYSRSILSPANYPESFAVGATTEENLIANFSLRGPSPYDEIKPDIVAPGVNIVSAIPGNKYAANDGTSMAAPAVSGLIALLLQANSNMAITDIENFIKETAKELTDQQYPETPNNAYGYGLIDAEAALNQIISGVGKVTGKLLDQDENPVVGEVSVLESKRSTKTNVEDGSFAFAHGVGDLTLVAEAYGYERTEKKIHLKDDEKINLDIRMTELPKVTIHGRISNSETGRPIKDAKIYLVEDANLMPVVTNEKGEYELTAYEGKYTLRVLAWNFISQDLELDLSKDRLEMNLQLIPQYTYPGDELVYDDGTMENAVYSAWDGAAWGVHMTLPEGKEQAMVSEGLFLFDPIFPNATATEFLVEVWDAKGEDGMPGNRLAGPIEAEAIREDGVWTVVDLRDYQIEVESDFYMVYKQKGVGYVPALAYDEDSPYQGRSYRYDPVKGWGNVTFIGNYMIRSRVAYSVEQPMITSPKSDYTTNVSSQNIQGLASPSTTVRLLNQDQLLEETTEVLKDGSFSFEIELEEGVNEIKALSEIAGDPTGISEPIFITLDTVPPEITVTQPKTGSITNKEVLLLEGEARDNVQLQSVMVNNKYVQLEDHKYSTKLLLQEGLNKIDIIAEDVAGNTTTETITVELDRKEPTIEEVQPAIDQVLLAGDLLTVAFTSDKIGGEASFELLLPSSISIQSKTQVNMEETSPGYYEASWKVPKDYHVDGAIVEVSLVDQAGNMVKKEAKGRLFISNQVVDRISGKNRFETAVSISQRAWEKSDTVLLANSNDFADALAGVPLAYQLDAPILLTRSHSLEKSTLQEIERLGAKQVIILGGKLAIHEEVEKQLAEHALKVRRLSGKNRYETAAAIADELVGGGETKVVVASGIDFADALSIASQAAIYKMPILLTRPESLPEETKLALEKLDVSETLVVGGSLAVSDFVIEELPNPLRIKGSNRFETNLAIQEYFQPESKHGFLATGLDYADALTGAVLAAKRSSSILLVGHEITESTVDYIQASELRKLSIFGGSLAVKDEILQDLADLLQ